MSEKKEKKVTKTKTKKEPVKTKSEKVKKEKVTKKDTKSEEVKKEKVTKKATKSEKVVVEKTKKAPAKTKREEKNKNALLEKKDQKRLRTLSKIVSVVAKIISVCAMIIVPILVLVMILIPIVFSKTQFEGNIIRFDNVRFVMNDDYITANVGEKTYVIGENIKNMDKVIDFLNSDSIGRIIASLELSLLSHIIVIIINIYLLKYIERLFDNIHSQNKPLNEENSLYIYKIGKLMIYSLITSIVFEIIVSLFTKGVISVYSGSYSISAIIFVFISYYVYRYATRLQEKSDDVIYD